ncbi:MAG: cytochrome c [Kofleriaceae bacterium]
MRYAWLIVAGCASHAAPALNAAKVSAIADVHADQVVSLGDITYALGTQLAIARGDNVSTFVSVDCGQPCPAKVWTSAAAVDALDGDGKWIVATRFDGTLWHVRLDGELDPIASRFGVTEPVRAVAGSGATVALLLDHALLVTNDGHHVTRFALDTPYQRLAAAKDRVALASESAIDVWDLAQGKRQTFHVEHAMPAFLAADSKDSRLVATAPGEVWIERDTKLQPLDAGGITAAAVAGTRVWIEVGKRLFIVSDHAALDTTVASAGNEPLFGAPNGDVWIGAAGLRRYALGQTDGDPDWRAKIQPIFQKVCAHCHLPGGDAGVDLSTPESWAAERAQIKDRVLVDKTMPPAGTDLDDTDRATLAAYLK